MGVQISDGRLKGKTIIFLGSSVTYGSATGGESFADMLEEKHGCIAVKEAVSGTTLVDDANDSYINRMKQMNVGHADLLICQLSTNDATQKKPLGAVSDSFEAEDFDTHTVAGAMEYILAYTKKTWGCNVAFYTSPKYESAEYQAMVDLTYALREKWGFGVIDMWNDDAFNALGAACYDRFMADPIHPTKVGYREWWVPFFEKALLK